MSVTFEASEDKSTMTATRAGIAFLRSEEIKILSGPGDEFAKASAIHLLYLTHGVEEDGTYDKRGWREANTVKSNGNNEGGISRSDTSSHSFMDLVHTLKWAAVGVAVIYAYQTLHAFYLYMVR